MAYVADNDKALRAFCAHVGDVFELAEQIKQFADDHFELSPEEVTWSDVASVTHVAALLKEASEFMRKNRAS